jgi:hypothetical protein
MRLQPPKRKPGEVRHPGRELGEKGLRLGDFRGAILLAGKSQFYFNANTMILKTILETWKKAQKGGGYQE